MCKRTLTRNQATPRVRKARWAKNDMPAGAGGFAGAMLNGTILDSTAANAATVRATNYTGGFVGHMGKSGVVDVDNVNLLSKLLGTTVGVVDLFGTQVQDCTVTGYAQGADTGIEVIAQDGQQPIAGVSPAMATWAASTAATWVRRSRKTVRLGT